MTPSRISEPIHKVPFLMSCRYRKCLILFIIYSSGRPLSRLLMKCAVALSFPRPNGRYAYHHVHGFQRPDRCSQSTGNRYRSIRHDATDKEGDHNDHQKSARRVGPVAAFSWHSIELLDSLHSSFVGGSDRDRLSLGTKPTRPVLL